MADAAPFQTAWDAALAGSGSLRAYAQLTLNPGLVKCAAVGRLRRSRATDVVAAIGTSLVVFAADGPGMGLEYICSAPIFASVLSIACVPAGGVTASAAGPTDECFVLTECGVLAQIALEESDGCVRLRVVDQGPRVAERHDRPGMRLLQKLVVDPLARALAVVWWLSRIEIAMPGKGGAGGSTVPWVGSKRQDIRTDGGICDAVFLAPSPAESHRILLVVAVMIGGGQRQSVSLHLYEMFTHRPDDAPALVAKLPLPLDMATPVHLVSLPAFPEHFLMLTETEAVVGSALQLMSGDIHLHRQPLPQRDGHASDIPRAVCVAGTTPLADATADEDPRVSRAPLRSPRVGRHPPASPAMPIREQDAQKVYVAMQSGALLRVSVAPRPFIAVETVTPVDALRLALGDVLLPLRHCTAQEDGASATDALFVAGDCTDNAIIYVTAPTTGNSEDTARGPEAPTMRAQLVLANHSPAVDCVLEHGTMYTTSGRTAHGAIQQTQLGHATWLHGVLVEGVDDGSDSEAPPVTQAWSLALSTPTGADLCVVLHHTHANMAAIEDVDGVWRVHEALRQAVADRDLVFVGVCGLGSDGRSRILCVCSDGARVVDVVGEQVLVVAGTYEPGVCLFRIDTSAAQPVLIPILLDLPLHQHLSDDMSIDGAPACPEAAVSDAYILAMPSRSFVLVGLRSGLLAWVAVPTDALITATAGDMLATSTPTVVEAGTVPVVFSGVRLPGPDHSDPDTHVVICAGSLFVACISDQSQLEVAPCAGEDWLPQPICKAVPLATAAAVSGGAEAWRFLVVSGQGSAAVIAVATRGQSSSRELQVEGMPRRIVRDRDTGLLLVASTVPPATACLSVLDPVSGQTWARVLLQSSERVCSLAMWYVQGPKLYRYVCVGTSQQAGSGGRLVIFSLKPAKRKARTKPASPAVPDAPGGCELKYVWESERRGPVTAVASMGDATLVVAVGASCVVLRLDVEHKQVVECCSCALRFRVTSLDVDGHDIVAGSEREAVNVLRFTTGDGRDRLELRHSARFGVYTADARFLAPGLIAGVDSNGYVYVLGIPDGPSEFALDFVLGFHLGAECTRLRVGCAVRRLSGSPYVLSWSAPPSGAQSTQSSPPPQSLIVTAVDGAVWTVTRITDDAFVLLRLLEQAMLHMPLEHPARPLLAANGTATRAHGLNRIPPANVVDGTLAAAFAGALTGPEQDQVVSSSPDLKRMALEMAARCGELGSGSAAQFITGLIHALARTSSC
ncbi:hypothetical protein H4R19_000979 [Coemansia spiralis]|nr:hypothetical protein H4R19_000979 [Coemansia spiralis]